MDLSSATVGLSFIWKSLQSIRALEISAAVAAKLDAAAEKIDAVRLDVFEARETMLAQQDQIRELEARIRDYDRWDTAIAQYELVTIPDAATLYRRIGENSYICPACVNDRRIIPMQPQSFASKLLVCSGCKLKVQMAKFDYRPQRPQRSGPNFDGW
ncbi:hypothetical protein [Lysobacter capsici]|uniref:hypothetical protein n=1 Tax=Lysobacter capsici TaxID=435897 RepID=UPI0012FE7247|nr:hypothetical protein [Lysobacter capsici]